MLLLQSELPAGAVLKILVLLLLPKKEGDGRMYAASLNEANVAPDYEVT